MKSIEVDDELYSYIASQTKFIGESASDILRRLLLPGSSKAPASSASAPSEPVKSATSNTTAKPAAKPAVAKAAAQKDVKASSQVAAQPAVTGVLEERVTAKTLKAFDKKVDKFLFVLSQLYQLHQDAFSVIEDIRGKDRLYFAQSESELTASGKSTNPKSIPESPYWVVTNNNSEKKSRLLNQAMALLGYDEQTINGVVELVNQ